MPRRFAYTTERKKSIFAGGTAGAAGNRMDRTHFCGQRNRPNFLTGEHLQPRTDLIEHFTGRTEIGMSYDHHAITPQQLFPVATGSTDRQQVNDDHVLSEVRQ